MYTGPSWSWASVNGPIAYWNDLAESSEDMELERFRRDVGVAETWCERQQASRALIQRLLLLRGRKQQAPELIPDCNITLLGENPFGEVKSGRLRIEGLVLIASMIYVRHHESTGSNRVAVVDDLNYRVGIDLAQEGDTLSIDLELPFFADRILSEGPGKVDEGSRLTLFRLHHYVCLVLTGGPVEYSRIEIVRQSSTLR